MRLYLFILSLFCIYFSLPLAAQQPSDQVFPYFLSLKYERANARIGPGKRFPIRYVYMQKGQPLKIVDRFERWHLVQDHDGKTAWINRSQLSSAPYIRIKEDMTALRSEKTPKSPVRAWLNTGVLVLAEHCENTQCYVSAKDSKSGGRVFKGWIYKPQGFGS